MLFQKKQKSPVSFTKKSDKSNKYDIPLRAPNGAERERWKELAPPPTMGVSSKEVTVGDESYRASVVWTGVMWMHIYFWRKMGSTWTMVGDFAFTGGNAAKYGMAFLDFLTGTGGGAVRDFLADSVAANGRPLPRANEPASRFAKKKK